MSRWLVGTLLMSVILSSCGRKPIARKPVEPEEPAPAAEPPPPRFGGQTINETGSIMFVCNGSGKHEEKEVLIDNCPFCSKRSFFVSYNNSFYCFNQQCEKEFPRDQLKCGECGFVPKKVRLKK